MHWNLEAWYKQANLTVLVGNRTDFLNSVTPSHLALLGASGIHTSTQQKVFDEIVGHAASSFKLIRLAALAGWRSHRSEQVHAFGGELRLVRIGLTRPDPLFNLCDFARQAGIENL